MRRYVVTTMLMFSTGALAAAVDGTSLVLADLGRAPASAVVPHAVLAAGAIAAILKGLLWAAKSPFFGFIWLKVPPTARLAILGALGAGATAAGVYGDSQSWVTAAIAAITGIAAGTAGAAEFVGGPPKSASLSVLTKS